MKSLPVDLNCEDDDCDGMLSVIDVGGPNHNSQRAVSVLLKKDMDTETLSVIKTVLLKRLPEI